MHFLAATKIALYKAGRGGGMSGSPGRGISFTLTITEASKLARRLDLLDRNLAAHRRWQPEDDRTINLLPEDPGIHNLSPIHRAHDPARCGCSSCIVISTTSVAWLSKQPNAAMP